VFLQAESEVAAINMVTVQRGLEHGHDFVIQSRHQFETGRYLIHCRWRIALRNSECNALRTGLGGIHPSQGDYFQAVKGGGHGDYRLIVLAPGSVQEMADLTMLAFELADNGATGYDSGGWNAGSDDGTG